MNKTLAAALLGIEDKKSHDVVVLDISEVSSFTDYFVLCTGTSSRQNQAIADAVEEKARETGAAPTHVEGYPHAEWILLDFIDFVCQFYLQCVEIFFRGHGSFYFGNITNQGCHVARDNIKLIFLS